MGVGGGSQPMPVTSEVAAAAATRFLRDRFSANPSATVTSADTFYGYYTFDVTDPENGTTLGMLSVNGTTAQIWYHTWHGAFIQGREIE